MILFGFKGCGKTYWGKKLADHTGLPFIDTDHLLEKLSGRTCKELFLSQGEEAFRALEHQVIASLSPKQIIAVGGGAVLDPRNITILQALGPLVYLQVDKEILRERYPPHLEPFDLMYEKRLPQYEAISAHRTHVDSSTLQKLNVAKFLGDDIYGK